jgi:hypothetical protein
MLAEYPAIRHLRWASAASVLMLGACGGDSMPNSATPAPSSSSPPMMPASGSSPPPLMATFDSIQANMFTPICAGCHGAELASIGGATLSAPAPGVNGERVFTRFSVAAGGSGNSPGD